MQVASIEEIRIQVDRENQSAQRSTRRPQIISCLTFKAIIFGTLLMWTLCLFYILATI